MILLSLLSICYLFDLSRVGSRHKERMALGIPSAIHAIFKWIFFYPSATSRIIIITKPIAKAIVPVSECLPCCVSGISSSTTT